MKKFIPGIVLFIIIISCDPKVTTSISSDKVVNELVYDSALATKLGADQYGMRQYVLQVGYTLRLQLFIEKIFLKRLEGLTRHFCEQPVKMLNWQLEL